MLCSLHHSNDKIFTAGNLNRVDKKGYLDLDFNHELEAAQFLCQRNELVSENSIKNKIKQKKQKQSTLSVFASKEELDQLTKAKVITLRKVRDEAYMSRL